MSEVVRSFISVKMPPEAIERLREAQDRLRAAEREWKWVNPESFHITLKFLGDVELGNLAGVWESVRARIAGCAAFTMVLHGLGVFPDLERPRVAWAGIDRGAAEITGLAERVEAACESAGFPRERRPFAAHLTLGRARQLGPSAALAGAIREMAEADLGEVRVDRVLLMKSELTPAGAVHGVLEEQLLNHGEKTG